MHKLKIIRLEGLVPYAAGYARQQAEAAELAGHAEPLAKLILLQHAPVYTLGRTTKKEHLLGLAYGEDDAPAGTRAALYTKAGEQQLDPSTGSSPLTPLPQGGEGNAQPKFSASSQPSSEPEIVEIDRGGSVTYHGPGQLTAYLLLNLKRWDFSIHQHLWNLEEAAIRALATFGIEGQRVEGMTGVWAPLSLEGRGVGGEGEEVLVRGLRKTNSSTGPSPLTPLPQGERGTMAKLCAIGVASRKWVTYHGIGLNVDLDLAPFERIDPCGLGRKPVTSLARLLGRSVPMREAEDAVVKAFSEVLGARLG